MDFMYLAVLKRMPKALNIGQYILLKVGFGGQPMKGSCHWISYWRANAASSEAAEVLVQEAVEAFDIGKPLEVIQVQFDSTAVLKPHHAQALSMLSDGQLSVETEGWIGFRKWHNEARVKALAAGYGSCFNERGREELGDGIPELLPPAPKRPWWAFLD